MEHNNLVNIIIDIESPTPLFTQLVEQIKQAVSQNNIKPGDALPSIRQLANDLAINSKTVAKAYKLLERDTIIQAKGYRGTFVHNDAKQHCHFDINQLLVETLEQAINTLKEQGATDSEIRIAFTNAMTSKK